MNIKQFFTIKLSPKTAHLAGVIIGDGHLSNSTKSKTDLSLDYKIRVEISDKNFIYNL